MHLMIENGIRGGIAQCCKRYSKAKNPYIGKEGDTHIMYLDVNNLYGGSLSQYLPTGGFEWIDPNTIGHILDMKDDADVGYILEVDVDYPEELHDLHADLPVLAEHFVPPGSTHTKLCTTLNHKKNYVVHYVALKQALELGLKLTKIHRVIKFNQLPWPYIEPYIEMNNLLRRGALNEFEDVFCLNIIYGKMMEQVRERLRVQLALSEEEVRKLVASPGFLDRTVYTENVVAVHLAKEKITINKPIYGGLAVLDLSKSTMYDTCYNKLLKRYGDKMFLCYMDTDSYVLEIITKDLYEDMQQHLEDFDISNYPPDHKCFNMKNKKILAR
jgi:hypothetical protein